MKKTFTILFLLGCFLLGSPVVDAKKARKKTRSSQTTTRYYNPSGHEYYNSSDGVSITLRFNSHNNWGHADLRYGADYGYQQYSCAFSWTCSNNRVNIKTESILFGDQSFVFSSDGRSLIQTDSKGGKSVYRMIR